MKIYKNKNLIAFVIAFFMLFTIQQPVVYADSATYDWQGMGAVGSEKAAKLKMLDPDPDNIEVIHIAADQNDCYTNQIVTPVNGANGFKFVFTMDSGMGSFGKGENFVINNMSKIFILDESEENIVASYDDETLKFYPDESYGKIDETGDPGRIVIGVEKDILEEGNYVLYFGSELCGNNTAKILGAPVKFRFSLETVPELSELITEAQNFKDNAELYDENVSMDEKDKWGKYPEKQADLLQEAIDIASVNTDDSKEAARKLKEALTEFKNSVFVGIESIEIIGFDNEIQVGDSGIATASVVTVPDEDKFKAVEWNVVSNDGCITLDPATGEWIANYPGTAVIEAASIKGTVSQKISAEKKITVAAPENGGLSVNITQGDTLQEVSEKAADMSSISYLKISTSKGAKLSEADIKYIKGLSNITALDMSNAECDVIDFMGMTNLESIILPRKLDEIGEMAFGGCTALNKIEIPASVQTIASNAFEGCTSLPETINVWSVTPPEITGNGSLFAGDPVTGILVPYGSNESYKNASAWSHMVISDAAERVITVNDVKAGTLESKVNEQLELLGLDESEVDKLIINTASGEVLTRVTDIRWLQNNCLNATTLDLSGAVLEDNKVKANYFKGRVNLKSVYLDEGIVNIGDSGFAGCVNLQHIELPEKLEAIGNNAFQGCVSLPDTIVCNAVIPPQFNGSLFSGDKTIRVPSEAVSKYKQDVGWGQLTILPNIEITLNKSSISLEVQNTTTLTANTVLYGNAGCTVLWKSSDAGVIALSDTAGETVTVKAIRAGTAEITAYDVTGTVKAVCKVTVKNIPAPSSVTAVSSGYNSIKVSWKAVTGASGYEIYRSTSAKGSYSKIITLKSDQRSYTNTGLTTGKTYYYKVRPYKIIDGVTYRGEYSAAKSACAKPAVPTLKAVSYSYNKIKVSWNKVNGATGYKIYRAASRDGKYYLIKNVKSTVRTYIDADKTTGKNYYYKIRAYRTANGKTTNSSYSSAVKVKPLLGKVKGIKAVNKSNRKINLTWNKVSGADGYTVYRSVKQNSGYAVVKNTKKCSYTTAKLTKNKKYYFKVRAYRTVNGKKVYGPYSSTVSRVAK